MIASAYLKETQYPWKYKIIASGLLKYGGTSQMYDCKRSFEIKIP